MSQETGPVLYFQMTPTILVEHQLILIVSATVNRQFSGLFRIFDRNCDTN